MIVGYGHQFSAHRYQPIHPAGGEDRWDWMFSYRDPRGLRGSSSAVRLDSAMKANIVRTHMQSLPEPLRQLFLSSTTAELSNLSLRLPHFRARATPGWMFWKRHQPVEQPSWPLPNLPITLLGSAASPMTPFSQFPLWSDNSERENHDLADGVRLAGSVVEVLKQNAHPTVEEMAKAVKTSEREVWHCNVRARLRYFSH